MRAWRPTSVQPQILCPSVAKAYLIVLTGIAPDENLIAAGALETTRTARRLSAGA